MSVLWFELQLALRQLWRRKLQTGLILATFTISLSLALLSWSLFYAVFCYNPPCDPGGSLYVLTYAGTWGMSSDQSTRRELEAYREGQTVFSDFGEIVFYTSSFLHTPGGLQLMIGAEMSSDALRMAGAKPELGRLFTPEEERFNGPDAVLLSHRIWKTRFGGDPAIVGKLVQIGGSSAPVIGIMPADFRFPNDQDIWHGIGWSDDTPFFHPRAALVRLKPGVTPERAAEDMQVILSRLGPDSPENKAHRRVALVRFRDYYVTSQVRVSALVLFSLALLFIVVGCVNGANLLLIDLLGREAEIAAALALGIPKRAAIRGVCFQVAAIVAVAALLSFGVLLAVAPVLHRGLMVMSAPYWLNFSIGLHHVLMATGLAALAGALAVVAPIACLVLVRPERVIRANLSAGRVGGRGRARKLLLAGQTAVLTVLGICAGLLVRSSLNLGESHWDYDPGKVFIGSVTIRGMKNWPSLSSEQRHVAFRRVLDNVSALPSVRSAAFMVLPMGYSTPPNCSYATDPAAFTQNRPAGRVLATEVTDQLFSTIGVPFLEGDTFPQAPPPAGWNYAIVNSSLAARLWPRADPLHRALYVRRDGTDPKTPLDRLVVVGVIRDFQASGPMAPNNDCLYTPFDASHSPGVAYLLASGTTGVPTPREIGEAVQRTNPGLALYYTSTVKRQIDAMLSSIHLTTRLSVIFAAAAILLCAIGMYSLTVAQVLQSSREFGIRIALGAETFTVWRHFVRGHFLCALAGVGMGLAAAVQVTRFFAALLFGVASRSPAIFLSASSVILAVTVLACIPSLVRLRRINPADCLRSL